jgi:hypothetical protein
MNVMAPIPGKSVFFTLLLWLSILAESTRDSLSVPHSVSTVPTCSTHATLGYDGTDFYGYFGYFRNGYPSDASQFAYHEANAAGHGLFKAHLFSLQARAGVYFANRPSAIASDSRATTNRRTTFWSMDFGELSFHLPFSLAQENLGSVPEQGIHAGWHYPVVGNPDAVLFGNYTTRFGAYPFHERYPLALWDSLGSVQTRVSGLGMALGRKQGWARFSCELTYLEHWFSLQAEVSGRLGRAWHWGVGLYQSHIYSHWSISQGTDQLAENRPDLQDSSRISDFFELDTLTSTTSYTFKSISPSARISWDVAASFKRTNPEGFQGNRLGTVFAEAAVIGWKNQPYAYAKRTDRLVWTAGAHLPTWGFLDRCTFQMEWMKQPTDPFSRESDDIRELPLPGDLSGTEIPRAFVDSTGVPQQSPWKIGLYLSDELFPHVLGQFQAIYFEESDLGGVKKRYQAQVRAAARF